MKKKIRKIIPNLRYNQKALIFAIICGLLFFAGYWCNDTFLIDELTQEEFKYCEQIARDVYMQKDAVIYEIPDNVFLEKTNREIKVGLRWHIGKAVASLENGELVVDMDYEFSKRIFTDISAGILVLLVLWIIIDIKQQKNKKQKI